MNFTLRPATLADCPTLAEIHVEGWRSAYAAFMPPDFLAGLDPLKDAQWFREWIFAPHKPLIAIVAEAGAERVGFVLAGANEGEPFGYDAEVYKLFIRPGWQNHGLGGQLMQAALSELRRQAYQKVCIWTFRQARSGEFYQKLGFGIIYRAEIDFTGLNYPVDVYGGELKSTESPRPPLPE
jgi:GNAT superfamily N-acetyltransferase